jgi:fimbrial isopeptide formation D2 family protein/uncharacterized repeat protein (TIGR01451 family)
LALAAAAALGLVGLVVAQPEAAKASFSTGGTGRFRDLIDWFEWGANVGDIVKAGTVTNIRTEGATKIETACTIFNISSKGNNKDPLRVKRPGSWKSDGFDNLYNIGGTDGNNQQLAGITHAVQGDLVTFTISCKMTLIDPKLGSTEVDLPGLVFADAEASGSDEYVTAKPGSGFTGWRIIDRYRGEDCKVSTIAKLANDDTLTLTSSASSECEAQDQKDGTFLGGGPTAVAFMEGTTSATVTIKGKGLSAVAIGVVSFIDWGDADSSYGAAGVLALPPWTGGLLQRGNTDLFEAVSATDPTPKFALAEVGSPGVRLGNLVDGEPAPLYSVTATGDDANNLDDEDLAIPATITGYRGGTVILNDLECVGDGRIWGWIDFNESHSFGAEDWGGPVPSAGQPVQPGSVPCASAVGEEAVFSMAWDVPADAKPQPVGKTAIVRMGITTDSRVTDEPVGVAITGELEDHAVDFLLDPYVVEKTSTATEDSRVGDVITYSVKITTPTATGTSTTPDTIVVKDDLSDVLDDATWLNQTGGGGAFSLDSSLLTWTGAPPAAGASKTITYQVQINGDVAGNRELKNVAWVDNPAVATTPACDIGVASGRDPDSDEPCASLNAETPSLALTKTSTNAADKRAGDLVTYTVTATNEGPGTFTEAAPATIWDDLSGILDDVELVSVSVDRPGGHLDATADAGDPYIGWSGPLADLQSVQLTYTVRLTAAGDGALRNVAWVRADPTPPAAPPTQSPACALSPDSVTGEVCAVVEFGLPRLEVFKQVDAPAEVRPGDVISFTVTAKNTGQAGFDSQRPLVLADDIQDIVDGLTYNGDGAAKISGAAAGQLTVDVLTGRLYWVGELAQGASVVITYSFTATGHGNGLAGNTAWAPRGQTAPAQGGDEPPPPDCLDQNNDPISDGGLDPKTGEPCAQVIEKRPLLRLSKTVRVEGGAGAIPGATVTYTITGANVGAQDYTEADPAPIWDDLTEVVASAAYNNDAKALIGQLDAPSQPAFSAGGADPTEARDLLKWSGPLAVGETVVITYSVTLAAGGAGTLRNVAWAQRADPPATPACDQAPPLPDDPTSRQVCAAAELARPLLEVTKVADASDARAGDTVHYTVTARNVGAADFTTNTTALVHDYLGDVMDDAAGPPTDLKASRGNPAVAAPSPVYLGDGIGQIRWEGVLAVGETVTIEYDVKLKPGGNGDVKNVAWSPLAANRSSAPPPPTACDGGFDKVTGEPCAEVGYRIPDFDLSKSFVVAGKGSGEPLAAGDELTFTILIENNSGAGYTGARPLVLTDSLASTLGDSTIKTKPAVTGVGAVDFDAAPLATYSGALGDGESATITYTVVLNAAGDGGFRNIVFAPGGGASAPPDCVDSGGVASAGAGLVDSATNQRCARVDVSFPVLRITKSSNMPSPWAPGRDVTYNVQVTNIGPAAITGATVMDDLSRVTGNACADWAQGSQTATSGAVTYAGGGTRPTVTWVGDLDAGASATFSFAVTTRACADNGLVNVAWQPADPADPDPQTPVCDGHPLDSASGEPCAKTDAPLPTVSLSKTHQITRGGQALTAGQAPRAGDVVTYTITAENVGSVPYTSLAPLVLRDDLSQIGDSARIDQASWANVWAPVDAADEGSFALVGGHMVWTGTLTVGQTLTLTFKATLLAGGDPVIRNVVWEPANPNQPDPPAPSECVVREDPKLGPRAATGEACADSTFARPVLAIAKTAQTFGADPLKTGDKVEFAVTITNTGSVGFPDTDPARFYDSLEDVLIGASYNQDAAIVGDDFLTMGAVSCQGDPCARIEWEGPLAAGASVTVTFSVTLEGRGEALLYNVAWAPTDPSGTAPPACPATGADPDTGEPCGRVELRRSLIHMEKVVEGPAAPRAGDTLTYSVTFRNVGDAGYDQEHPAYFYDDLSEVLANAKYNGDAATRDGSGAKTLSLDYDKPLIKWSGSLPAWGQVTLTYSVTLTGAGTASFTNVAWAPVDPDESAPADELKALCPPRQDVPGAGEVIRCASVTVDRGLLEIEKRVVDPPSLPHTGDTLTYEVTMTNSGAADYPESRPAVLRDDLTEVLTGAHYQADAAAVYSPAGAVPPAPVYSAPHLVWSGPLAQGQSVTVTYQVMLRSSETSQVSNLAWAPDQPFTATTPPPPPSCDAASGTGAGTGEACAQVTLDRGLLTLSKAVDLGGPQVVAQAGDVLTYTVTVKNASALAFGGADSAVAWDHLTDALKEADWVAGSLSASVGAASYKPPTEADPTAKIKWSGPLAPAGEDGDTATFSYSLKVTALGNGLIRNVAWVPFNPHAANPDSPTCQASTDGQPVISISSGELCAGLDVRSPLLALSKFSSPRGPALPGDVIDYSIVATNVGGAAFTAERPAVLKDDLSTILDDVELVGTPTATLGQAEVDSDGELTWEHELAVGQTVTISFKVKVIGGGDGQARNVVYQPFDPPAGPVACDQATGAADPGTGQACAFDNHPLGKLTLTKALLTPAPHAQGKQAQYQIMIENTGGAAFTPAKPATVVDDISGLLDGGRFNNDQKAVGAGGLEVGALSYAEPLLTWTGALNPGEVVTLTYSVTWLAIGDGLMRNVVWQPADPDHPQAPACANLSGVDPDTGEPCAATDDRRPLLEIDKTSTPGGTPLTAGDQVSYTLTAKNVGQADYTDGFKAVVEDSLSALLGAATFNHDAAAKINGQPVSDPVFRADTARLRWEGPLAQDQTVTITFSITLLAGGLGVGRNLAWSPVDPEMETPPRPTCSAADAAAGRDSLSGEPCDEDVYHRPTLSLTKSSDATSPKPGDIVTFTLVAMNTSEVDFTDQVPGIVRDYLGDVLDDASFAWPQAATVTGPTPGELTYDDKEAMLTWSGALKAGESVTITLVVELLPTGDGYVRNVAWRPNLPGQTAPEPPDCPISGIDPETVEPCAVTQFDKSGLKLTKTASPADPMPGVTVDYTVTLKNTGRIPFTESAPVWLWDDLTDVMGTLVGGSLAADRAGNLVDQFAASRRIGWSGALAPGEVVTVTYSVQLDATMGASRSRSVAWVPNDWLNVETPECVDADNSGTDESTGEVCAAVALTPPVLEVAKSSTLVRPGDPDPPPYARPGDQVIYSLHIKNVGSGAYTVTHPAVVVDSLSQVLDDATWDNAAQIVSGPGALVWSAANERLTWSGDLSVKAEVEITYSVTVKAGGDGQLANVVWVPEDPDSAGDPPACDQAAGEWCASGQVALPELSITKSVTQTPADGAWQAGVRLTYTLTLENTGRGDFEGVSLASVRDELAEVLDDAVWVRLVSKPVAGTTVWDPVDSVLTWTGPLASGAVVALVYEVDLTSGGDGQLRNLAWFPSQPGLADPPPPDCEAPVNGLDPDSGEPCALDDRLRAILQIVSKSADGGAFARPGDTLTYTIVARNRGAADFTDARPAVVADSLEQMLDEVEPFDLTTTSDGGAGGVFGYTQPVLRWLGPLAAGAEVTLTYQVRLKGLGDGVIDNVVWAPSDPTLAAPAAPGCDDPAAVRSGGVFNSWSGADPESHESCAKIELRPPIIEVSKTSQLAGALGQAARPGDRVDYTFRLRNVGLGDFTDTHPAVAVDSLELVLDDTEPFDLTTAADGGAGGALSYEAPLLKWSGPLAAGAEVAVTYSVILKSGGDGRLANAVWLPEDPDNPGLAPACAPEGDWCAADDLKLPSLAIAKTATQTPSGGNWQSGVRLTYTLTLRNTGPGDFTDARPAVVRDDLTDIIDDAVWAGVVAKPSGGQATWASPVLTWSGPLAAGAAAELVYAVDLTTDGDGRLRNLAWFPLDTAVASPPEPGCEDPVDGLDPDSGEPCALLDQVRPILKVTAKAVEGEVDGVVDAHPGETVTYQLDVRNIGPIDFTAAAPALVADSLADLLDDAEPFDLATASDAGAGGEFSYAAPVLEWRGELAQGAGVTITYSVRLKAGGDGLLKNVAWVPRDPGPDPPAPGCDHPDSGGIDPETGESCVLDEVEPPILDVVKTVQAPAPVAVGSVLNYTVKVTNSTPFDFPADRPAEAFDDLSEVLDDASYQGDAVASRGTVRREGSRLIWSGSLAAGQTATITYSVKVVGAGDGRSRNVAWAEWSALSEVTVAVPAGLSSTGTDVWLVAWLAGLALAFGLTAHRLARWRARRS